MRKANTFTGTDLLLKALAYQDKTNRSFETINILEIWSDVTRSRARNKLNAAISRILSNMMDQVIKDNIVLDFPLLSLLCMSLAYLFLRPSVPALEALPARSGDFSRFNPVRFQRAASQNTVEYVAIH